MHVHSICVYIAAYSIPGKPTLLLLIFQHGIAIEQAKKYYYKLLSLRCNFNYTVTVMSYRYILSCQLNFRRYRSVPRNKNIVSYGQKSNLRLCVTIFPGILDNIIATCKCILLLCLPIKYLSGAVQVAG